MPKIWVYRKGDDNPHACTALRLAKAGDVELVRSVNAIPRGSLLLDPFSQYALSPADATFVGWHGLVLIDCSWEHAELVFKHVKNRVRRALPFLIAGNPVKQDQPVNLSTAEALAAALYILGWKDKALEILNRFKWGAHFFTLNQDLLDKYASCLTSREVVEVQLSELERRRDARNPPSVLDGI
ncbi:MAG TPA: DUF367 family protein [Thermoprotei archaeon]|nr:DUF367 family protein [Thermoprotei archaeon]